MEIKLINDSIAKLLQGKEIIPALSAKQWEQIYQYGCNQFFISALAHGIAEQHKKLIPNDFKEATSLLLELNTERNIQAIEEFKLFANVLTQVDIYPIPLKGLNIILALIESDMDVGLRMIRDIDLLIEPENLGAALNALKKAGYVQAVNHYRPQTGSKESLWQAIDLSDYRNSLDCSFHHVPVICRPGSAFGFDLHTRLNALPNAFSEKLTQRMFKNSKQVSDGTLEYRRIPPTEALLHLIYHCQIRDGCYGLCHLDWRSLFDAKLLLNGKSAGDKFVEVQSTLSTFKINKSQNCFWYELEHYLGYQADSKILTYKKSSYEVRRFEFIQGSMYRIRLNRWLFACKTRLVLYRSIKQLRMYFGPLNPLQLLKAALAYGYASYATTKQTDSGL